MFSSKLNKYKGAVVNNDVMWARVTMFPIFGNQSFIQIILSEVIEQEFGSLPFFC